MMTAGVTVPIEALTTLRRLRELQTLDFSALAHVANAARPEKAGITSCANRRSERNVCWWGKVPQANAQIT